MTRVHPVLRLGALVVAVGLLALSSPGATAQEETGAAPFPVGNGTASGTVASARIFYGGLSIPVPVGQSASSFEGTRARALGAVVSASAVSGLTGADVPGTAPVTVDSQSEQRHLASAIADPLVGTLRLDAADTPRSRSDVHVADLDLPGVARVEGGRATSTTSAVDGRERVAESVVTIASISLGGGLVELRGLRWTASHHAAAGADPVASSHFDLGELVIAGVAVPLPPTSSLQPVIDTVNGTLGPLGITVTLPKVARLVDGSVDASALKISYGRGPLGTEVVGPVLAALRPLIAPVLEAAVSPETGLGVATLLLDLGLGIADGSGGAELYLGGVNAGTDAIVFSAPAPVANGGTPVTAPGGAGRPTVRPVVGPGTPTARGPALVPAAADGGPLRCALAASPRRQGDCRSASQRAALAAGVVVLLALGGYEVAIRRRRVPAIGEEATA